MDQRTILSFDGTDERVGSTSQIAQVSPRALQAIDSGRERQMCGFVAVSLLSPMQRLAMFKIRQSIRAIRVNLQITCCDDMPPPTRGKCHRMCGLSQMSGVNALRCRLQSRSWEPMTNWSHCACLQTDPSSSYSVSSRLVTVDANQRNQHHQSRPSDSHKTHKHGTDHMRREQSLSGAHAARGSKSCSVNASRVLTQLKHEARVVYCTIDTKANTGDK